MSAAGLFDAPRRRAPLVLVTGGKGGIGKSTVCANLALSLGARGVRVLVCDLDLALADLHVLCARPVERTLEHFLSGEARLEELLVPLAEGVDLLPGANGSGALARLPESDRKRLMDAIGALSQHYELTLADSAAGVGPDVLAFAAAAERVLVVTSGEPAALTDAYGLIKALDQRALECGSELPTPELVVNLAGSAEEAEQTARRLRGVCERFLARSPRLAGWLPRCAGIASAALRQRPFVLSEPRSLASRCVELLAERLSRSCDLSQQPLKV